MAQKVNIMLVDDLDGSEAHETVPFALDGATYEIDLNKNNADDLRTMLAPYQAAARTLVKKARKASTASGKTKLVREWARANGIDVPVRGTLSAELVAQYDAAH